MDLQLNKFLCCPVCKGKLYFGEKRLKCLNCDTEYPISHGIPMMFSPAKVEKSVLFKRYLANYQKIAGDDLKQPLEKNKVQRYLPLKDFIGNTKECKILDVGSAHGEFLRMLNGKNKVAFDIALNYLKVAKRNSLIAVAGDAEELPFEDSFFEIVICSDVLEHALNPKRIINEIIRVLAPGGKIYLVIPWKEDISKYDSSPYEFTHLRRFDRTNIRKFFSALKIKQTKGAIAKKYFRGRRWLMNHSDRKIFRGILSFFSEIQIKRHGFIHLMIEATPRIGRGGDMDELYSQ